MLPSFNRSREEQRPASPTVPSQAVAPTTPKSGRRPFVSSMKAFFQSEEKESNNQSNIQSPSKPAFIVAPASPRSKRSSNTTINQSPPHSQSRLRPTSSATQSSSFQTIKQLLQNEQEVLDSEGNIVNQSSQSINHEISQELIKLVKSCGSINQVDCLVEKLESWLINMFDASYVRVMLVQALGEESSNQSNNQTSDSTTKPSIKQLMGQSFVLHHYPSNRSFPVCGLVNQTIQHSNNQIIHQPYDHPAFDELIDSIDTTQATKPHSMIVCRIEVDSDSSNNQSNNQTSSELIGVVQLYRCNNQSSNFTVNHLNFLNQSISLINCLINKSHQLQQMEAKLTNQTLLHQSNKQSLKKSNQSMHALLDIARILSNNQSINQIVRIIVRLVPELIDSDRCTVYFVDRTINQTEGQLIVSRDQSSGRPKSFVHWIFGQSESINQPTNQQLVSVVGGQSIDSSLPFFGKTELRLPMIGLAGHVATTGEVINVKDAHDDTRFNSQIDRMTGYRTRSLLAVPMVDGNGVIIGVVQAINKSFRPINKSIDQSTKFQPTLHTSDNQSNNQTTKQSNNQWEYGEFTREDEILLSTFSAQAALAVRTSQLFQSINEQNHSINLQNQSINQALKSSAALLEITQALSSELKLDSLIKIICSKVQSLLNSERCTVFIVDREKSELYTSESMSYGMGPSLPIEKSKQSMISFPMDRGIAGAVATSGNAINVEDAYNDIRFNQSMDRSTGYRTRSILCMPIKNHRGEISGVLQVMNKRSSNQTINQTNNQTKQLTLQPSSDASDRSINQSKHRSTPSISQTNNPSETEQSIKQSNNQTNDDITPTVFTADDEQMLQAFCAQAAVALENSRLFNQTERALNHALADQRNLKFMFSVTKNLFSDLHMTSMIDQMTMQVHHLLKADDCALYLVDETSQTFWLARENEQSGNQQTKPMVSQASKCHPFSTGVVGYVARTGECVRISTAAQSDYRFHASVDQRRGRTTHSILCCPIKAELPDPENPNNNVTRIVGVMSVRDEKDRGGFENEEEKLLRVFCAQASLAIMNSQRFATLMSSCDVTSGDTSAAEYLKVARGMNLGSDDIGTFQFRMDELTLLNSIGTGSYGEVFKAAVRGNTVAVKKLHVRSLQAEQVDSFCKEASLMCQLDHPNIVTFIGAVTEPSHLCILTQYCSRGSLADLLLEPSIKMNFGKKLQFSLDAAKGMLYLHQSNPSILHRDLKSDNLLVTQDWTVKVGDFGLTRFLNEKKPMTQVGTPMWMAPEIIMGKNYTEKADVYAFGIILWEILTREEPYEEKEPMQIVVEVVNEGLRPTIKECYAHSPLIPLMTDCWATEAAQRPTFEKIVERLAAIKENTEAMATTEYGF